MQGNIQLTPEQVARIEQNRQAALAKLEAKRKRDETEKLEQEKKGKTGLTPEQEARIEQNRQAALAKLEENRKRNEAEERKRRKEAFLIKMICHKLEDKIQQNQNFAFIIEEEHLNRDDMDWKYFKNKQMICYAACQEKKPWDAATLLIQKAQDKSSNLLSSHKRYRIFIFDKNSDNYSDMAIGMRDFFNIAPFRYTFEKINFNHILAPNKDEVTKFEAKYDLREVEANPLLTRENQGMPWNEFFQSLKDKTPCPGSLNSLTSQYKGIHRIYMMFAYLLLTLRQEKLEEPNKNDQNYLISAIMVDKYGKIISYGLNNIMANSSFHAEANMLVRYFKEGGGDIQSLKDCTIYTTLKPCLMCAGLIKQMSDLCGGIKVIYAQNDPSPFAKNTLLDQGHPDQHQLAIDFAKPIKLYNQNEYPIEIDRKDVRYKDGKPSSWTPIMGVDKNKVYQDRVFSDYYHQNSGSSADTIMRSPQSYPLKRVTDSLLSKVNKYNYPDKIADKGKYGVPQDHLSIRTSIQQLLAYLSPIIVKVATKFSLSFPEKTTLENLTNLQSLVNTSSTSNDDIKIKKALDTFSNPI